MRRSFSWTAILIVSALPNLNRAAAQATAPSLGQGAATAPDSPKIIAPLFTVRIKPGPANKEGHVGYVDVAAALQASDGPSGQPVLAMAIVFGNIDTIAKTMQNLTATDAKGVLPLEAKDDPDDTQVPYRHWVPTRPVVGDLNVRYRAPINTAMPKRTGGPLALRTEGGGFSGCGCVFLVEPAASKRYRLALRWDLSELGPKSTALSSLGEGDVDVSNPEQAAAGLNNGFFMAGPLHRYPKSAAGNFSSAWLDSPFLSFDPELLMAWTAKLYDWYLGFFKPVEQPYRVFLRYNPVNPGGGVGLLRSFALTYDQNQRPEPLLVAYEMVHTFAPSVGSGRETLWFEEGLAVFYQRLLPLRAGAVTSDQFLSDLNETAGRYYTDVLNTLPNDQVALHFWEDTRIRTLPYDRGSMYLAVVDKRMRKASGGKRSLDDLIFTLLDREKKGLPTTPEVWVELITKELGPAAKEEYEAMLGGAVMLPDSDTFGPCFARTTAPLRRFELGFDAKIMGEPTRIIRGLIPGSEGERAGLRNGDEIVDPVALDLVQARQKQMVTLQIRREGKTFPVTYLPRGETIEVPQWRRIPGVADSTCPY